MPGQLIVSVHEGAVRPSVGAGRLSMHVGTAALIPDNVAAPLDYLVEHAGAMAARPLLTALRPADLGLRAGDRLRVAVATSVAESPSEELAGLTVVDIPQRELSSSLLKTLNSSPAIQFVEPMPARWLAASSDPRRNRQWGLGSVRGFETNGQTAESVTVAILDSGIDRNHPDLASVIDSYDAGGFSMTDVLGHGTHVSGIVAAVANLGAGTSGLSSCRLAVWKIFPDNPSGGGFYVDGTCYLRALEAAIGSGARALNLSIAGAASSQTEQILFSRLERFGVTVVAAMGNDFEQGDPTSYPAAYEGVLAVGAINELDERAPFSNTGRHIGLAAPGANILSTVPTRKSPYRDDRNYAVWNGTSMAAPHVTAAAALVAAKHPSWSAADVKAHLCSKATKLPAMRKRAWTREYGNGLLNVQAALK